MIKDKIIEFVEKNKPKFMPAIQKYFPSATPLLRRHYLKFRGGAVETAGYALPHERLNSSQLAVPKIQISKNAKTRLARNHLLVVVLTDSNKFMKWFDGKKKRNWDLWVLDLRKNKNETIDADSEIISENFITKTLLFTALKKDIAESKFSYVSFFDDDLETTVENLNDLFKIGMKYRFMLFQPSLTLESEVNHANLKVVLTSAGFRAVPIVEIMCPFLKLELFLEVADLALLAPSGWGFDIAISNLVANSYNKNPIVIDKYQVRHSRRSDPKNGDFYRTLHENSITPQLDLLRVNHFLGFAPEDMIMRNISHINDFRNPIFEDIGNYSNWDTIKKKGFDAKIAILMTKNESDVLSLWVCHHIDYFDLIVIVDDGSVDGSKEYLEKIHKTNKILMVRRIDNYGYIQREIVTWLARYIAMKSPASIIFPLDTDEFLPEEIISEVVCLEPDVDFWTYKWSTAIPMKQVEHTLTPEDLILVEVRNFAMKKIVVRSKLILDGFEISQGNHNLEIPGSKKSEHRFIPVKLPDLIHIPVRSLNQIKFKSSQTDVVLSLTTTLKSFEGSHWRKLKKEIKKKNLLELSSTYLKIPNSRVIQRKIIRISGKKNFLIDIERKSFDQTLKFLAKKN